MARTLTFETEEELDYASCTLRRDPRGLGVSGERRHRRRPLQGEFRLHDEWGWGPVKLVSTDISQGGVFLASDLLFAEGEGFIVEFESPVSGKQVRVWSRVVRVAEEGEVTEARPGMGFEFVDLSEDQRRELVQYVSTSDLEATSHPQ